MLNITFSKLSFEIENKNFSIEGSCGSSTSVAAVVGVVVPVAILLLILVVVIVIILVRRKFIDKKKILPKPLLLEENEYTSELHDIVMNNAYIDDKGLSNVERNVVQGHKRIGESTDDCLLREKEKVTNAVTAYITAKQQQEAQIYDRTEHIGGKKSKTKATVPGPGGRYSNLNLIHPNFLEQRRVFIPSEEWI